MAIISQLAIVAGMVLIGWRHFDNTRLGIAAAILYLLMPYTAWMNCSVDHVLPGALVLWAVAAYRNPFLAGSLIGVVSHLNDLAQHRLHLGHVGPPGSRGLFSGL